MKKPNPQFQTPTSPKLKYDWEVEMSRLKLCDIRVGRRKVWPGNLLNALVIHFLDMKPGEREEFAVKLLKRFQERRKADAELPGSDDSGDVVAESSPPKKLKGLGATEKPRPNKADSADSPVWVSCPGTVNGPRVIV